MSSNKMCPKKVAWNQILCEKMPSRNEKKASKNKKCLLLHKKLLTKMIKNNISKTTGLIYDEICFHLFILD